MPKSVLALRRYNLITFRADAIAGVTVGLIGLPLAMAFDDLTAIVVFRLRNMPPSTPPASVPSKTSPCACVHPGALHSSAARVSNSGR
jgi:hypothetical protein